jgi:hypothetical protein
MPLGDFSVAEVEWELPHAKPHLVLLADVFDHHEQVRVTLLESPGSKTHSNRVEAPAKATGS